MAVDAYTCSYQWNFHFFLGGLTKIIKNVQAAHAWPRFKLIFVRLPCCVCVDLHG